MIFRWCSPLFLIVLLASCSKASDPESFEFFGLKALEFCSDQIEQITGKHLSPEVDRAYIEVFPNGYTVGFTHGTAGTFGRRSADYKMILACGVSTYQGAKLAVLRAPLEEDFYNDQKNLPDYQDFSGEVTEILFNRIGGTFKYCCSQAFDPKNIERHNPSVDSLQNKGKVE